jgi:integrase
MARTLNRLTAREAETATQPGMYADGGGLYLRVARGGKSWVLRYMLDGNAREMGLGGLAKVGLADARKKAAKQRLFLADKVDPIERRKAECGEKKIETARAMTFDDCAAAYIKAHQASWRHPKHHQQWTNSLARHVSPAFGHVPVGSIDIGMLMNVLEPLWTKTPETASRIRGRIESVLDWAKARGFREGENPARWRGHLSNLLPRPSKVRAAKHYAALPYAEIGAFMSELRSRTEVAAAALEFLILTAARTSEVAGSQWDEIDRAARTWIVPAARMKGGREHRVPLSGPAMAILDRMKATEGEFIFSSHPGRGLGKNALLKQLNRMGYSDLTVHGFRSSFRDWAAERTNFPSEVAEMALAHAVGSKVEAAYRRGDLFDKRRRLMEAWAEFLAKAPIGQGKIVTLGERKVFLSFLSRKLDVFGSRL